MSANKILNKKASHKPIHDSVTIIGGSYIKGRDWHATPLDWMPGTLVLVNSIQSLLQYGVLKPPSNFWILIFSIILIVITSWLLVKYGKLIGGIFSFVMIVGFIILSFAVFKYSIWFSFAIPWTAVQIRQGFDF